MYNAIYDSLIIAKKVIYLPTCHSTNDIAAELVRQISFEEGTVVITDEQTKGKGQRGSVWLTEPGKNLTMSVILNPFFVPVHDQFNVSKAVAVGVWSYLSMYSDAVRIKWPNDIYLGDKKICGTLIENSIQGSRISSSIAGIGVNINQTDFQNARATSLLLSQNQIFDIGIEFQKLARHLDVFYFKLKSAAGKSEILSIYENQLYGFHQVRKFKVGEVVKSGTITGVSDSGMLRVQFDGSHAPQEFNNKEIEWLWED